MHLDRYTPGSYTPGAPYWKQLLWYFVGSPLVKSYALPLSSLKVRILRSFGAQVGVGVRIKPGVRIKFPWRLVVGDYAWIGEDTWIDNLALVTIESHVCLSQGVYLCTGNHDWSDACFQLRVAPIYVETKSWIAARCVIGPGVRIGAGAVLTLGSVVGRSLEGMTVYAGNPVEAVKVRKMKALEEMMVR
jgi:putative colanic acid biosynthesis acetyltransferase WcaF